MTDLPPGVSYRSFDDERALATEGTPVYGEPTVNGWRRWSVSRSKLARMIDEGMEVSIPLNPRVLYLGAASGTTASHVADIAEVIYAVEFSPRTMRDLLEVADDRPNLIPLLKDARHPERYAHVVEAELDILVQDVATRDQARVALDNRQFLAQDGRLLMAIKARSEDVTMAAEAVFESVLDMLEGGYEILETTRLDPVHVDHLAVVARTHA